ncbi:putative ankyrin repeat protein RF_0381 [Cotesia glomerata]|uniref:putative ankyrin repeat protein RF_0381 n=1 Tax=Cotesia glomerata TaxID=32391 RepID=UPI001D00F9E7|nr:putative ankyrin repeat protein RF_0381 [Cotesia glomerata]
MAVNSFGLKDVEGLVKFGKLGVNSVFSWKNSQDISVLQFALMNWPEGFIDFILREINFDLNLNTALLNAALYVAIKEKKVDIVKMLVSSGADVNRTSGYRYRVLPLHQAIECRNYDIIEFLVTSGANVNANVSKVKVAMYCYNSSALTSAIFKHDTRLIELLLNNNATIDHGSAELLSTVRLAVSTKKVEILQLLKKFGAKFDVFKDGKLSVEFEAVLQQDKVNIFKFFVENCDFLDLADAHGNTLAHLAAKFHRCKILRYLLNCEMDIYVVNNDNSGLLDVVTNQNIQSMTHWPVVYSDLETLTILERHIIRLAAIGRFISENNSGTLDGDKSRILHEQY